MKFAFYLWRADRQGSTQLRFVLAASLSLGIAALVALERFADRIESTIRRDSKGLMAADFQIQAWRGFDEKVLKAVEPYQKSGNLVEQDDFVASAVPEGRAPMTISLRALRGDHYPFYGSWVTEPQASLADLRAEPEAIVDSSLKARNIKVDDELKIGDIKFKVKAFLKAEPQTVASAFSLGPRVIIHLNWAEKTGLMGHGSRVFHELLIKSSQSSKDFKKDFRRQVPDPHWRLITPEHANRQAEKILERIRAFLSYVGLTALFLGGAGLFVIFRSQFLLKLDQFLTLRCLGAPSKSLYGYALLSSLGVAAGGWLLGTALGLGFEQLVKVYAMKALQVTLADASLVAPLLLGACVSLLVVGLAVLVPMSEILRVPVSNVIRQDQSAKRGLSFRDGSAIFFVSAILVFLVGRNVKSGSIFLASLCVLSALLVVVSSTATTILSRITPKSAFSLRYGLLEFTRHKARSQLLVVCTGLGLFLLSTVLFIAQALRHQLTVADRLGVPNFYLLSVSPEWLPKLKDLIPHLQAVPTAQARLVSLKSTPIESSPSETEESTDTNSESSAERFYQTREYFISRRPENAGIEMGERLASGSQVFGPAKANVLRASLEEGFAERMKLQVGDPFTLEIAGVVLQAEVRSLRRVDWFDMHPNFFMVFAEADLKDAPMDDVAFTRLPKDQIESYQRKIAETFPQVTALDGEALGQRLVSLLDQLSLSVFAVSLLTLGSCLFVLLGLTLSRRPEVMRSLSLWRCLGLNRKRLERLLITESLLTGFLGSFAALFVSLIALAAISKWVLEIPFEAPKPLLLGLLFFLPPLLLSLALKILVKPLLLRSSAELFRQGESL